MTCTEMLDVIKMVFGVDTSAVRERRHYYVVHVSVRCVPLRVYVCKSTPSYWRIYDSTGDGWDAFAWDAMLTAEYIINDELDRHY